MLTGAETLLPGLKRIKTEVTAFEAYAGCVQLDELAGYLAARGFRELSRNRFAVRPGGGGYYDVVFARSSGP